MSESKSCQVLPRDLCVQLGESFCVGSFGMGPVYSERTKDVCVLLSCLYGQAKLAIWLTHRNRTRGGGPTDPVVMLRGMICARLRLEFM